ncbi:thiaminase II [Elizabethkingia anophelis]|uniref:thiaminase II n=1 Tax=Elizabethkingia anophelis TaxID=1117645 RepID=UPI000531DC9A|nr:thiaminase II [Elizabethkingia anophelis]KGT10192.1 transcriptional regulator [Elizabethkingia anophelis]MCT4286163.1 thiaminase II [Elizabethkingia anophelis]MDV3567754.1 thiaminase II [Elizabethkingia anophelis]MDV3875251.1 thiaminase II [Elizabethkingia anophelis]MDV3969423.1 thiaminase II [Elizabethkingia anophelis]
MKWSEYTWKQIEEYYQLILAMPFVKELAEGSLSKEKFQFYMAQDSLYLEHFGRALALIGARAYNIQDVLSFTRFAENAIVVENALHESYFKDFDVTEKGKMQLVCHHYVHFLKSTAALDAVEIAMAAVLPCFWIYQKVGDYIYDNKKTDKNPYKKWIDTYSGEEFALAVQQAIEICDRAAEATTPEIRVKMTEAFITATQMEYYFWQAAYDLKSWI